VIELQSENVDLRDLEEIAEEESELKSKEEKEDSTEI
jgi:hypothetical protein